MAVSEDAQAITDAITALDASIDTKFDTANGHYAAMESSLSNLETFVSTISTDVGFIKDNIATLDTNIGAKLDSIITQVTNLDNNLNGLFTGAFDQSNFPDKNDLKDSLSKIATVLNQIQQKL